MDNVDANGDLATGEIRGESYGDFLECSLRGSVRQLQCGCFEYEVERGNDSYAEDGNPRPNRRCHGSNVDHGGGTVTRFRALDKEVGEGANHEERRRGVDVEDISPAFECLVLKSVLAGAEVFELLLAKVGIC